MKNDKILLKRLKELYKEFYNNGGRQIDIMRVTGLKQSTVSRYMNGSMPLNENFLQGFMNAIGKSMEELKPYMVYSSVIPVKYTLSGKHISSERVEIMMMGLSNASFGITVDTEQYGLRRGSILIVSEDVTPSDLDDVVLMREDAVVYGVLEYKPDMFTSGWGIRKQVDEKTVTYIEVTDKDTVRYVVGVQYPKEAGRRVLFK